MEEANEPRQHRRATWLIVTVLAVVFVLYPLTIGPMYVLWQRDCIPFACMRIYLPLYQVSDAIFGSRKMLNAYESWWCNVTDTPDFALNFGS